MKKLIKQFLKRIKYAFSTRYEIVERVELPTKLVCIHVRDKRTGITRVEIENPFMFNKYKTS